MKNKFNIMLDLSFCSYMHFTVSFYLFIFLILPTRRHRYDYTVFETMPPDSCTLTINIVKNIVCADHWRSQKF